MGASMTPIKVGDEVVCVDDGSATAHQYVYAVRDCIVQGEKYIVRWVGVNPATGNICVRLVGITRPQDYPFRADRFRPIVKTDISIFTAMLAPSPEQRTDADA